MNLGLIARSEDRGLGSMLREVARHLQPAKTLIVRPDAAHDAGLPMHYEWFDPDAIVVPYHGHGPPPEAPLRAWLDGLDVVLTAETFYWWQICDWAREAGCRTVQWLMPEYFGHGRRPGSPWPDVIWNPTTWRLEHLPTETRVVPVPVPIDRWPDPDLTVGTVPRWVHVAGAPYPVSHDRNGTRTFLAALKYLRGEHRVTIRSQGLHLPVNGVGDGVHVEVHTTGVSDYWRLYDGADGLVMPRRYGGLSLVALEAMGAGLGLVMPDVEPQRSEWPIAKVSAEMRGSVTTSAGQIPLAAVDPADLAAAMNDWGDGHLGAQRRVSRAWAEQHSWDVLKPAIIAELERACS